MGGRSGVYYRRHGKYIRKIPLSSPPPGSAEEAKPVEETKPAEEPEERYHYFYDKATPHDGFHYEGDGHHQVEWFKNNSNVEDVIRSMSSTERDSIEDYWAPGHFMSGQQYRGWDNMRELDKRLTQTYDDILDRSELRKGVTVVRRTDAQLLFGAGHYRATLAELQAMEGKTIISHGNMSCGAAAEGLTIGDDSKRIEYRFKIPGGSKGAGMWIGDSRINSWGPIQREFMMSRDVTFKVGKTRYDSKRDVYVVDMKYDKKLSHDYGKTGRVK